MSDSMNDNFKANLEKAKVEGTSRAGRIGEILRAAFSQTVTEVKEGSQEIRSIVGNSIATVTGNLNFQSHPSAEEIPPSGSSQTQVFVLFQAIKNRVSEQMQAFDTKFTNQYGDRYETVKQRWNNGVVWYNNARANSETPLSNQLHQRQALLEQKVGNAGASIAQKEQHIREQVKTLFQTTANKS